MNLDSYGLIVESVFYRVVDFPEKEFLKKGPDALDKMLAYRFDSGITHGLFPYRGVWDNNKVWCTDNTEVGLYVFKNKNTWRYRIRYPKNKTEKKQYDLSQAKNTPVAVLNKEYSPENFTNIAESIGMEGKAFIPPVRYEDDALNALIKTGIRKKNAPFAPYGKILEEYTNGSSPSDGTNRKNNSKRSLYKNTAMSISKGTMYADVWDFDFAIIIRDVPGAMYPMFDDGTMLIHFPTGHKFDIDPSKLKDADEYILQAIEESAGSIDEDDMED